MRRVPATWSLWLVPLTALATVACPLDERQMLLLPEAGAGGAGDFGDDDVGGTGPARGGSSGRGGSANSSNGGESGEDGTGGTSGGGSGGTPNAGSGGMSGMSGSGGMGAMSGSGGVGGLGGVGATAACPDLDRNGEPDCEETLVMNPAFNDDAGSWRTEFEVTQVWSSEDAREVAESGSVTVTNGGYHPESSSTGMAGSEQCLPVTGGKGYRAVAETFIPTEQGDGVSAGMSILFYGSNDCSGASLYSPSTLVSNAGGWVLVDLPAEAPTPARSAKVRLVAVKPFRLRTFRASFDNVLFRAD